MSIEFLLQADTYSWVLKGAFVYMALIIVGGMLGSASYGRFANDTTKINLSPRLGWFLMELPASVSFIFFFFQGKNAFELVPLFFLGIWCIHYANRGFIFPLLMRVAKGQKGTFNISIVLAGWLVTSVHGYLNAVFISHLSEHMTTEWFSDPRFIIGMSVYAFGYLMNLHSDHIIRNLRSKAELEKGERIYRIPQGGLFKYVSSPSYLTEIISFVGFAIATWSLGAVFVLGVSAANLIPRAIQSHRWYQKKFEDYPKNRKALIPFLL